MEAERIEALAVHFAAGTAAAALTEAAVSQIWGISSVSALILAALLAITFKHSLRDHGQIMVIYFMAGTFCFLTASIGGCWASMGTDPLTDAATGTASMVKSVIDSIPFRESETSGLVKALLTGDRSGIDGETTSVFRESGASHILALSGLHLGFIYLILRRALTVFGNSPLSKRIRGIIAIAVSGFYTLATGASPSLVRAFLFITVNEIASLSGREKNTGQILSIALFLQLAFNPLSIRSLGFQLSYLAMAGLTLLYPRMESWFPSEERKDAGIMGKLDIPRRIWQAAALSLSCQVFTAPLVWFRFRTFPQYFLLTNLIAMPLTTIVMGLSILSTLLSALGTCPEIMITANEKAVSTLVWALTVISEI